MIENTFVKICISLISTHITGGDIEIAIITGETMEIFHHSKLVISISNKGISQMLFKYAWFYLHYMNGETWPHEQEEMYS